MNFLSIIIHFFLKKDSHNASEIKNEKIVNHVNDALIDVRNAVNRKKFLKWKSW